MRHSVCSALAVTAGMLIACQMQPALPDPLQGVPAEVQELVEKHGLTDAAITETAEQDETCCLWPPAPRPSCSVYAVTFLWGQLVRGQMPPFPLVDWSGELHVLEAQSEGAAIRVVHRIDFEEGQDELLPVTEPAALAWISQTAGDYDGLSLLIRLAAASDADSARAELCFKTGPIAICLPFSTLDRLVAYYPVDHVHGAAVLARRVPGLPSPRGYIKGEWLPEAKDGASGSLRGAWYDLFGIPVGSMAGRFWTGPEGEGSGQFEGWLSGVQLTVVLAEFHGTWSRDASRPCATCAEGYGLFQGTYRYLTADRSGVMRGAFGDSSSAGEARVIPLVGTWRDDCLTDAAD